MVVNLKSLSKEELREILLDPVQFSTVILDLPPVSETEAKIMRSKANRICIAAGRRWGKTTLLAIISIWTALVLAKGKGKIAAFTGSWEQSDIFMDAVREVLDLIHPEIKKMVRITEDRKRQITINGCQIFTRSATRTSRSIRGHGRGVILLIRDEDAFIPDVMMKQIRPIRLSNRAKEIAASTPLGHNHFYKDFNSKVYESYRVTSYDNKLLDKKDLDEEKQLLTKAEFDQEYMAEFLDDRYSVFPQTLIDEMTDFNRAFLSAPKEGIQYVMGIDLGRRRDATVVCIAHADLNHIVVDFFEEVRYLQDGRYWHNVLGRIEELIRKYKVQMVHIDQTGIGDKPTEDLRNSLLDSNSLCGVKGVDFTRRLKNSKEGLINGLLLKMERKELHVPFCQKLIRQLKNIRFEASDAPSRSMGTYGTFTHVGHDDFVSALLLAVNALPDTQEIFYSTSNPLQFPGEERFKSPFEEPMLIVTNPWEGRE
ncbi:MAG: hypothetical protein E3J56_00640 [Candidatus Aminicenantes bacterium]|nr:MAG: hypothetical protein E3J56_00640 [Candidatus Aminicenantes bacterium]